MKNKRSAIDWVFRGPRVSVVEEITKAPERASEMRKNGQSDQQSSKESGTAGH